MYCEKCRKHSPENFQNCAYCGAKLAPIKKKQPEKFKKKIDFKLKISLKTFFRAATVLAIFLTVCAIVTAIFTSSKPEGIVKSLVESIEQNNKELYVSLYDKYIYEYKKENRYFADEETVAQMASPVNESRAFYKEKCGEDFKLKYKIETVKSLNQEEKQAFSEILEYSFDYIAFPTNVDILSVEIIAKGENGEYKSVYNDFWCMKIKGKWYMVDKTVSAEYLKTTS